jgi:hypothetical protein
MCILEFYFYDILEIEMVSVLHEMIEHTKRKPETNDFLILYIKRWIHSSDNAQTSSPSPGHSAIERL